MGGGCRRRETTPGVGWSTIVAASWLARLPENGTGIHTLGT
jgi:hypothetical protein